MTDKYLVNLSLTHTPSLTSEEAAQKDSMEALYQNVRDRVSTEHCTRLEIQELYHTIFANKGAGTLAEKIAKRLEVDQEEVLDIGLDTFFNMLMESCSYEDELTAEVAESALTCFKDMGLDESEMSMQSFLENIGLEEREKPQEESEEAEKGSTFDNWTVDLVGEGEWVSVPPALFNRIGNFIELPFPCLIHDIQVDWVDVISLETLQSLA